MTVTMILATLWALGAWVMMGSGHRAYSPLWINIPFSLLWPVSLPLSVALGLLGLWDQDLDPTE
jgi:hypothetical protein